MKFTLLAIGKSKRDGALELAGEYQKRIGPSLTIHEFDSKGAGKPNCKEIEAEQLTAHIPKSSFVICMDERGTELTSVAFARKFGDWQNAGHHHFCFIIGGADGIAPSLIARADFKLALGRMTWPHRLAKVMILEQIYRAKSILDGHPYHRE